MPNSCDKNRRLLVKSIAAVCLLSFSKVGFAKTLQVVAVRVWPSSTYTRITIESNLPISYKYFYLKNPNRLVVDIHNLSLNDTFRSIKSLVRADDPYIERLRVGQNTPTTARLVIDLRKAVNPNLFTLKPFSTFQDRFVIDLYPAEIPKKEDDDPVIAILEEFNKGNYEEAEPKKLPEPSAPPKKKSKIVIVIDPGHGGEDPGAVGFSKTKEKDIVLQISKRLKKLLDKEKNMIVHLTRNDDVFLPLRVRVEKARALHADVFISIHADSVSSKLAKGSSVFALSEKGASSTAARFLARTQNESDEIGGVSWREDKNLNHALLDLVQTTTKRNSLLLGNEILKKLGLINNLHKPHVETAGFAVLKAPDIPSVLVETAFISNQLEEKKLKTEQFQNQISNALLDGIKNYLKVRKV